jgi:hypothetical protein
MKASRICWIVALLLLPAVAAESEGTSRSADMHAEIQTVYNFQPHTLTSAPITEKSAVLDEFWNQAKSQRDIYVPALRKEFADFSNPHSSFSMAASCCGAFRATLRIARLFSRPSRTVTCAIRS